MLYRLALMEGLGAVLKVFERTVEGRLRVIELLALCRLVGGLRRLRGLVVLDRWGRLGERLTPVRTLLRGA